MNTILLLQLVFVVLWAYRMMGVFNPTGYFMGTLPWCLAWLLLFREVEHRVFVKLKTRQR